MSLVNDMLRDLDRRKQFSPDGGRINGLIGSDLDESRPNAALLPLLIAVSVLAGLGAGYFLFDRDAAEPVLPATPMVSEPVAAVPEVHSLQTLPEKTRLEIADVSKTDESFSLRLRASSALAYAITERSSTGIALKIDGVEAWDNGGTKVEGLSVIQMPDHTLVELTLDREADIELYANPETTGSGQELVLAASYRSSPPVPAASAPLQYGSVPADYVSNTLATTPMPEPAPSVPDTLPPAAALDAAPVAVTSTMPAATTSVRALDAAALPLRVTRGLTLEQQDRNTSQSAVTLMQGGRLLEAYEKLLTFLARNPEAHVSRETLGTILLAQHEYAQAGIVVDEGLALAPNYAPYKKIKARLLMQDSRVAEALQLMEQLPPALQADQEYHELLATLYQQNGDHAKAISTYQQLLRTNGSEGRWWTGMGISLEAQGDAEKALASYQAALQQASLDAGVRQYSQNRVRSLSMQ